MEQKRRFTRANYPCSFMMWREDGFSDVIFAHTANISVGGLAAHLNQALPKGVFVEIKIDHSPEAEPLRCRGKVLRCEKDLTQSPAGHTFYKIAIEFQNMAAKEQQALEDFVNKLLQSQQEQQDKQA